MTGKPVAIVGCRLIGESWAALMSAYGHDVRTWDPANMDETAMSTRLGEARAHLHAIAGMTRQEGAVTVAATLVEAVARAGWVQDNAPEDLALKRALHAEIEAAADAGAVIASSTTALVRSELAAELPRPECFVTAHLSLRAAHAAGRDLRARCPGALPREEFLRRARAGAGAAGSRGDRPYRQPARRRSGARRCISWPRGSRTRLRSTRH